MTRDTRWIWGSTITVSMTDFRAICVRLSVTVLRQLETFMDTCKLLQYFIAHVFQGKLRRRADREYVASANGNVRLLTPLLAAQPPQLRFQFRHS